MRTEFDNIWFELNKGIKTELNKDLSTDIINEMKCQNYNPFISRIRMSKNDINKFIQKLKDLSNNIDTFFNDWEDDFIDVQLSNNKLNLHFSVIEKEKYYCIKHNGKDMNNHGFCCLFIVLK